VRTSSCSPPLCVPATATATIYTLSLHDALPISGKVVERRTKGRFQPSLHTVVTIPDDALEHRIDQRHAQRGSDQHGVETRALSKDRKSTRLNSSHVKISYAVFCLKKKNKNIKLN